MQDSVGLGMAVGGRGGKQGLFQHNPTTTGPTAARPTTFKLAVCPPVPRSMCGLPRVL